MNGSAPQFASKGAIGWEAGPLDGLSCYLRCVEAVLRSKGLDQDHVVNSLLQILDLNRRSTTSSSFHGCTVNWYGDSDPSQNWLEIQSLLKSGECVILMPDVYYWHGHKFEGHRHIRDHMVLLNHLSPEGIHFLDTDGPAEQGFWRKLPVDDKLIKACSRYGRVQIRYETPFLSPREVIESMIIPQMGDLQKDIFELRKFREEWIRSPIPENWARAFHVKCLGDYQPQLTLLALALQRDTQSIEIQTLAKLARQAAKRSWQLGLALLDEHGNEKGYPVSLECFQGLLKTLDSFYKAISEYSKKDCLLDQTTQSSHFLEKLQSLAGYLYSYDRFL